MGTKLANYLLTADFKRMARVERALKRRIPTISGARLQQLVEMAGGVK